MSTLTTPAEKGEALIALTVDQLGAERLTGLSYETLERFALAGEPVGRIKVGRRVLFLRAALERWLASKLPTAN